MFSRFSSSHIALLAVSATLAVGAFAAVPSVHASVLVSDTFASGGYMNGRTPDTTDVPSTTWAANGSSNDGPSTGVWQNKISGGTATLGADVGDGIGLNNAATVYNISDTFSVSQNTLQDTSNYRGDGLGFFSSVTENSGTYEHGYYNFAGLVVNMNGLVTLLTAYNTNGPSAPDPTVIASTTVAGFNSAIDHTLSYSVNTTTGAISNILLDGNSVALSGNPFTVAATAYAGIYSSQSTAGGFGTFQNFMVSTPAVPEPATLALLGAGGLGLLLIKRRRTV